MYNVIIVDDELMIRNGISKIIPWKKLNVDLVLTAESGEKALQHIKENHIDLMLTDINMTQMNGLELIEKAKKINPKLKIIVLTGYDSFDYAQKCCKLQVNDFLLKPVDEKELEKTIKKELDLLEELRLKTEQDKMINRAKGVLEQVKLEKVLKQLMQRKVDEQQLQEVLQEHTYLQNQSMQAVVVFPKIKLENNIKEEKELITLSIKHLCVNVVDYNYQGITFEEENGNIIIVIFSDTKLEDLTARMDKLRRIIFDEHQIEVKVSIGGVVKDIKDLSYSYAEAMSLLERHQNDKVSDVFIPEKIERRMALFYEVFNELKRRLIASVGEYLTLSRIFKSFENCIESYNLSDNLVKKCCFDIASMLYYEYINENSVSVDNKLNALLSLLINSTKEDACKYTDDFLKQLFGDKETDFHETIAQAKKYISQNLSEDISVSSIAKYLYVTPNYFSRLFKKVCGEGCNEYIVRKRIHMAKSLLETTNQKTGKVAMLVGYRDTNYFSLAFKKQTGMSPTEYREKTRQEISQV